MVGVSLNAWMLTSNRGTLTRALTKDTANKHETTRKYPGGILFVFNPVVLLNRYSLKI